MGFWTWLTGREGKTDSLRYWAEVYGGGRESFAGVSVTLDRALEEDTVWACMRVIADGIAQVPWRLHREVNGSRIVATDHRLDDVLHRRPNGWMTSFEYRELIGFHLLIAGNHYSFINRVGSKREIYELVPLEPKRVTVKQGRDYSLTYTVTSDTGEQKQFGADAIWHLRGPSWNGWQGLDAIRVARQAIGLAAAIEQGQAEAQRNAARPSGLYSVQDKLTKEQFQELDAWLQRHDLGGDRSGRALIADRGATFTQTALTAASQQTLETRRHQVEALCRRFRVMPLMVGHPADMAARAATESIFLQHVVHTLMPWYQRVDQSADVNLLSEEERKAGYYTKLNPAGLMRGAMKDQAEYFARALGSGGGRPWLTQNDVRSALDLDPSAEAEADSLKPLIIARTAAAPGDSQRGETDA